MYMCNPFAIHNELPRYVNWRLTCTRIKVCVCDKLCGYPVYQKEHFHLYQQNYTHTLIYIGIYTISCRSLTIANNKLHYHYYVLIAINTFSRWEHATFEYLCMCMRMCLLYPLIAKDILKTYTYTTYKIVHVIYRQTLWAHIHAHTQT